MIRAILLDLGKVIVPFDFSIGYREMERRCGLTVEGIRERIRGTGLVPRFETGEIEPHDFVERLCAALEAPMSYEEFCRIWSSIFSKETLIPDAFLKALKASYRLILVSNTNAIHFEMIRETYPLLRHFDAFILSFEVGAMKPSPVIFQAAIKAAGCPAEECFFTDDIREYVEAAQACGIDAVPFEGFPELVREMEKRGIHAETKNF